MRTKVDRTLPGMNSQMTYVIPALLHQNWGNLILSYPHKIPLVAFIRNIQLDSFWWNLICIIVFNSHSDPQINFAQAIQVLKQLSFLYSSQVGNLLVLLVMVNASNILCGGRGIRGTVFRLGDCEHIYIIYFSCSHTEIH